MIPFRLSFKKFVDIFPKVQKACSLLFFAFTYSSYNCLLNPLFFSVLRFHFMSKPHYNGILEDGHLDNGFPNCRTEVILLSDNTKYQFRFPYHHSFFLQFNVSHSSSFPVFANVNLLFNLFFLHFFHLVQVIVLFFS